MVRDLCDGEGLEDEDMERDLKFRLKRIGEFCYHGTKYLPWPDGV